MSHSLRRFWVGIVVGCSIGLPSLATRARAADAPEAPNEKPKLLVRGEPAGALLTRIESELRAQGFDVVESTVNESDDQVAAVVRDAGAVALIAIAISTTSIELKINDTAHSQPFVRAMPIDDDLTVTAVRAVEIIRAHLINLLALVPPSPPSSTPPRPAIPARAPDSYSGLAIGFATTTGSLRATAGTLITTSARLRLADVFFADVWGMFPLTPATFSASVGTAQVSVGMVGAGVSWQGIGNRLWRTDFGLGASLAFVRVQGAPSLPGLSGNADASLAFIPTIRAGLSVPFAADWAMRADCAIGIELPRTVVYAMQTSMGTWGPPVVVAALSLERIWR